MKLKFLLVSALALAFMVPAALASSTDEAPAGDDAAKVDSEVEKKHKKAKKAKKLKKHSMRDVCRPRVGLVVRGELVAVDAEAGTFTVLVDKANRHGKRFLDGEATFMLAKKGKVRKHGKASLADLKPGYRVKVMGRACKAELKDDAETPDLYAKHVKAKAPVVDEEQKEEEQKEEDSEENTETTDSSTDAS